MNTQAHWDQVFTTKLPTEVSWFQPEMATTVSLLKKLSVPQGARIIDIGGGDSHFAEALLHEGYTDIHVLDISARAIERARERLASDAQRVNWIVSDVTRFHPETGYDLWYDRAAFHFLTTEADIGRYVRIVSQAVKPGGLLVVATFSPDGPEKCSGLTIKQYDAEKLTALFSVDFVPVECFRQDHITPAGKTQNFQFCVLQKK